MPQCTEVKLNSSHWKIGGRSELICLVVNIFHSDILFVFVLMFVLLIICLTTISRLKTLVDECSTQEGTIYALPPQEDTSPAFLTFILHTN